MPTKKHSSLNGIKEAGLRTIAATGLVLFATASAHAQISGDYTYDDSKKAYFVQGNATLSGDISGKDVFIGKNNAAQFVSQNTGRPAVLGITAGAKTTENFAHPKYPNGSGL